MSKMKGLIIGLLLLLDVSVLIEIIKSTLVMFGQEGYIPIFGLKPPFFWSIIFVIITILLLLLTGVKGTKKNIKKRIEG